LPKLFFHGRLLIARPGDSNRRHYYLPERVLPGALGQALVDVDTFFQVELPALQEWQFTAELAQRMTQPALVVLGETSEAVSPTFREAYALQQAWLPRAEGFVLPGATHMLQAQNPRGMADGLAAFFSRHPLAVRAP